MNISVIGTGFVGVVSAAVFSTFGHQVFGVDTDEEKVKSLQQGKVPFFEPQLDELLANTLKKKRLVFTSDYQLAIPSSEIIFIAVGTPSREDGSVDLSYLESALSSIAPLISRDQIIVVKSTVPPQSINYIRKFIQKLTKTPFFLATAPEFLREGSAVYDTLHPNRVVIGTDSEEVFDKLKRFHKPLNAPIIKVGLESAQMSKYAANAYLATRITFINQVADLCEKNGADVDEVIEAIGYDHRIGNHYWYPGLGYGGSCFPKDVRELAFYSRSVGLSDNLFNQIQKINDQRITMIFEQIETLVNGWDGKSVAVLGLSFKPNTDDIREAPSLVIVPRLLKAGAEIRAFDPQASLLGKGVIPSDFLKKYTEHKSLADVVSGVDIVLAVIEWPTIKEYEFSLAKAKKTQWFFDFRNQFSSTEVERWGFVYKRIGRGISIK